MGKKQEYSMAFLNKSLRKLQQKGSFMFKTRYYRHSETSKEYDRFNKAFRNFENKNVIDIGTHIGYYATVISSYSNSVLGIDISKRSIKQANLFKAIVKAKNTSFIRMSAFDLNEEFFQKHKIDALFNHKTIGKTKFNTKRFNKLMKLCEKYCDVIITDKIERIKNFFADNTNFEEAIEVRSYIGNRLYIIKRKKI